MGTASSARRQPPLNGATITQRWAEQTPFHPVARRARQPGSWQRRAASTAHCDTAILKESLSLEDPPASWSASCIHAVHSGPPVSFFFLLSACLSKGARRLDALLIITVKQFGHPGPSASAPRGRPWMAWESGQALPTSSADSLPRDRRPCGCRMPALPQSARRSQAERDSGNVKDGNERRPFLSPSDCVLSFPAQAELKVRSPRRHPLLAASPAPNRAQWEA